ncbi:MAG: hypothetical protein HQK76_03065 [Desulfobacterales bacterium]|nr:hypothetical protein [Desulfobacterales bacterium]
MQIIPEIVSGVKEIYSDESIYIVAKEAQIPSVINKSSDKGTVVNFIAWKYSEKLKELFDRGITDLGLLNRLDNFTSGLMFGAFNIECLEKLRTTMLDGNIQKYYLAIVYGCLEKGIISYPLYKKTSKKMGVWANKRQTEAYKLINAETYYENICYFDDYSVLKVRIHKGARHQIRAHLDYIKHSIVGDPLYKKIFKENEVLTRKGQMLHAFGLDFKHPVTNKPLSFIADCPSDFSEFLLMHGVKKFNYGHT